ncbi:hypothetical protein [Pseudoxanthomonas wuyuanensis]|uniref:DUF3619 family protein n=1 Tax=Pseudoxanthomonas wuyuanensis TaxID=1073196 RepID=A0A286DGS4_9GAMM|nr:hypothetical protein [Pseudoxanthomonas wuyuanensis]KAF1716614.1 hypothetical protein CSC75_19460 [Pseudoxanthomonas wuyuanensis]SOD57799.1 hypothetical protein SAMN06296416_11721 [Pseudoxanthomonas wuyuanensis]
MTASDHNHEHFDRQARQLHAAAVTHLSAQTLARLRAARHAAQTDAAPARRGHWRWLAATAFSAVFAVAIVTQLGPLTQTPEAPDATVADNISDYDPALIVLDENPDLYLWLASSEAQPLAME